MTKAYSEAAVEVLDIINHTAVNNFMYHLFHFHVSNVYSSAKYFM